MKILVAEDDTDAVTLYKAALELRGHTITAAFDGKHCLNVYRNEMRRLANFGKKASIHSPFDVVILDHMLPLISGIRLSEEIAQMNPYQRIIIASAFLKANLDIDAKSRKQIVNVLQKPFDPELLVEVVESLQERGVANRV